MLPPRAAVGVAAGVAGVVVQGLIVQGVESGGVEGVCHHPAHSAHVEVPVGGAGAVAGAEPQPGREAVVLGGVGVHDEDLRLQAVPLHRKGERVGDLGGNVGAGDAGVVLDAASYLPAGKSLNRYRCAGLYSHYTQASGSSKVYNRTYRYVYYEGYEEVDGYLRAQIDSSSKTVEFDKGQSYYYDYPLQVQDAYQSYKIMG